MAAYLIVTPFRAVTSHVGQSLFWGAHAPQKLMRVLFQFGLDAIARSLFDDGVLIICVICRGCKSHDLVDHGVFKEPRGLSFLASERKEVKTCFK